MKLWNAKYTLRSVYAVGVILLAFFVTLIAFNFSDVWSSLFGVFHALRALLYAVLIALLLLPFVRFFEEIFLVCFRKVKWKKTISSVLAVLLAFSILLLVVTLILMTIVPPFLTDIEDVQGMFTTILPTVRQAVKEESLVFGASSAKVGGLAGENLGFVETSYNNQSINVFGTGELTAGGLVGHLDGIVRSSFATEGMAVNASNKLFAGGLVGFQNEEILNNNATATSEEESEEDLQEAFLHGFRNSAQILSLHGENILENNLGTATLLSNLQNEYFMTETVGFNYYTKEAYANDTKAVWMTLPGELPMLYWEPLLVNGETSVWDGSHASYFFKGNGTAENPYLISSARELSLLSIMVNEGTAKKGAYYEQTRHIDLAGERWTPIGINEDKPFNGHYDGNGFEIKNFSFVSAEAMGVFGYNAGVIRQVVVSEFFINQIANAQIYMGGLCGVNNGQIIESATKNARISLVMPTATLYLGGLCGKNNGDIQGSFAQVEFTAITNHAVVGGLVGHNGDLGRIDACYTKAIGDYSVWQIALGDALIAFMMNDWFNVDSLSMNLSNLGMFALQFTTGTIAEISNIFMALMIAIYLLLSRRKLAILTSKLTFALWSEQKAKSITSFFRRLYTNFASFSSTRVFSSMLYGMIMFFVCERFALPLSSIVALVLMFAHLFPVLGPIVGNALVCGYVFLIAPECFHIVFLTVLLFELFNMVILSRLLLPSRLRPSFGVAVTVTFIGGAVFGATGFFLAIPIYLTCLVDYRRWLAGRLIRKNMPTATKPYLDIDFTTLEDPKDEDHPHFS